MKTEQLQRAKEIETLIDDYKSRIKASISIDNGEDCPLAKLIIQSRSKENNYKEDEFSNGNNITIELRVKIKEEIIDCALRIKRVFDKEIKKLEKELEAL